MTGERPHPEIVWACELGDDIYNISFPVFFGGELECASVPSDFDKSSAWCDVDQGIDQTIEEAQARGEETKESPTVFEVDPLMLEGFPRRVFFDEFTGWVPDGFSQCGREGLHVGIGDLAGFGVGGVHPEH